MAWFDQSQWPENVLNEMMVDTKHINVYQSATQAIIEKQKH